MSTYISTGERPAYGKEPDHGTDWREFTERRLAWQYGPKLARDIMLGRDEATNADIEAWKRLGAGKAVAA